MYNHYHKGTKSRQLGYLVIALVIIAIYGLVKLLQMIF